MNKKTGHLLNTKNTHIRKKTKKKTKNKQTYGINSGMLKMNCVKDAQGYFTSGYC